MHGHQSIALLVLELPALLIGEPPVVQVLLPVFDLVQVLDSEGANLPQSHSRVRRDPRHPLNIHVELAGLLHDQPHFRVREWADLELGTVDIDPARYPDEWIVVSELTGLVDFRAPGEPTIDRRPGLIEFHPGGDERVHVLLGDRGSDTGLASGAHEPRLEQLGVIHVLVPGLARQWTGQRVP